MAGVDMDTDTENDFLSSCCLCKEEETGFMIACDNVACPIEWFHMSCVGLSSETVPEESWICHSCSGEIFLFKN
jgi:hypothetical protein